MPSNPHFVLPVPSSSYRTPIRYPQWGAEVGTPDMYNSQPAGPPNCHPNMSFSSEAKNLPVVQRQTPSPFNRPPLRLTGPLFVLPDSSSSYRTPIRYPRWGTGGGHARHVQLPTGRPTPLSPQHVILERSEESPGCPTSNPVPNQPPPLRLTGLRSGTHGGALRWARPTCTTPNRQAHPTVTPTCHS